MNTANLNFDFPDPHAITVVASNSDADGYGHINNGAYVRWMDLCVWDHCKAIAMPPEACRELNRGFAVVRHEIDYLRSAYPEDELVIANWVVFNDEKLRAQRRFQIIRTRDQHTLLRAHSFYICTDLTSGRPVRMPPQFREAFGVLPSVAEHLEKSQQPA